MKSDERHSLTIYQHRSSLFDGLNEPFLPMPLFR